MAAARDKYMKFVKQQIIYVRNEKYLSSFGQASHEIEPLGTYLRAYTVIYSVSQHNGPTHWKT